MLGIGIGFIALSALLVAASVGASDTVGVTIGIIGLAVGVILVVVYDYLTDTTIYNLMSAVERLDKEVKKRSREEDEHNQP